MEKSRKNCTGWDFRMLLLAVLRGWSMNGVVVSTEWNCTGFSSGRKKRGRNNEVPVWQGSTVYTSGAILFRAVLFQDLNPDTVFSVSMMILQLSLSLSSLCFLFIVNWVLDYNHFSTRPPLFFLNNTCYKKVTSVFVSCFSTWMYCER